MQRRGFLLALGLLLASVHGAAALTFSTGTMTPGIAAGVIENPSPLYSATTFNNVTITPPAVAATLTLGSGKVVTISNTLTMTGTDSSTVAFGAGGTVVYTSAFGTGVGTFLATPTSANLLSALTTKTGTNVAVFNTAPTLVGQVAITGDPAPLKVGSSAFTWSRDSTELGLGGGAYWDGTGWNTTWSANGFYLLQGGVHVWFSDSGLTAGVQFSPTARMSLSATGDLTVTGLATTGAATGKTIVCADTNGKLYRSSSNVTCAN